MDAAENGPRPGGERNTSMETSVNMDRMDVVALAWLWTQAGKAKKAADVAKGIGPMVPRGAEPMLEPALDRLAEGGMVERTTPKRGAATYAITEAGRRKAAEGMGIAELPPKTTGAKLPKLFAALGAGLAIDPAGKGVPAKVLQGAVVAKSINLCVPLDQGDKALHLAMVKGALAKWHGVPVDKIYLKKLPAGELPALVVAPLLKQGGSAASKLDKLIEATALQALEVSSPKAVEAAVVRYWIAAGQNLKVPPPAPAPTFSFQPNDRRPFPEKVMSAAQALLKDGGPGLSNLRDKALIHHVWRKFTEMFGPTDLASFKARLLQANRHGVILVCEDLITDARREEFAQAEARIGTSAYHYIRLD